MYQPSPFHPLTRLLSGLTQLETIAALIGFCLMTGVLLADLIGREIWSAGVFGASRVAIYAMILSAMAGFGLATATGRHLRPKVLDGLIPKRLERPALALGQALSAMILLTLTWFTFEMMRETLQFQERDLLLRIAVWPAQAIMVAGFGMSALRHLIFAAVPALIPAEQNLDS
jgi:TRAP-type C4-dicarboxylate transport system permease small subunit